MKAKKIWRNVGEWAVIVFPIFVGVLCTSVVIGVLYAAGDSAMRAENQTKYLYFKCINKYNKDACDQYLVRRHESEPDTAYNRVLNTIDKIEKKNGIIK